MNQSEAQSELLRRGHQSYAPNYNPRDVVFESALGSEVTDVSGKTYLDFGSGIGVNCLGHRNESIIQALDRQANKLWHTSNIYFNRESVRLADALVTETFASKVFFCNSGAEANEAAIKIARRYGYDHRTADKNVIITFEGSFHGRTLATTTATAQPKYQTGFGPLPEGFRYAKFNDSEDLEACFDDKVCAVLLEPIQGESGVRPFSIKFLEDLHTLCQRYESLLIVDEIQCGMGRSGKLFAYQWAPGVVPDIATVAKAFGAGMPIGATLLGEMCQNTLRLGSHGSTFGGNALCCAVANVVFEKVCDPQFLESVSQKSQLLTQGLVAIDRELSVFSDIRGKGLMIGAELNAVYHGASPRVLDQCLDQGLLVLQAGPDVIRLLPAYTIDEVQIEKGLAILKSALKQALTL